MIRGLFWGGVLALVAVGCGGSAEPSETSTEAAEGGAAGAPVTVPEEISGAAGAPAMHQESAGAAGVAIEPSGEAGAAGSGAGGVPDSEQPTVGAAQGGSSGSDGPSGGAGGSVVVQGEQPSAGAPQGGSSGAPAACACTSGECCDGCHFLPSTHVCETHALHSEKCSPVGSGDFSMSIIKQYGDLSCSGADADCTQWKDTQSVVSGCPSNQICSKPGGTDQCHAL